MKVAIFGATGFSGKAILEEALNKKHQVTILVRDVQKVHIKHLRTLHLIKRSELV